MSTLTWISNQTPYDWTDTNDWRIGTINPAGPPVAGDTAILGGQISLEQSLSNITLLMPQTTGNLVLAATNVDFGDNFLLQIASLNGGGFALDTLEILGTGTLDDSLPTHGLTPKVGEIDTTVGPLTIELAGAGGTGPGTFIDDGTILGVGLTVTAADTTAPGTFINNSTIDVTGIFNVENGVTLAGGGVVDMDGGGATGTVSGPVSAGETISFVNQPNVNHTSYGGLTIADLSTFQGTVNISQDNQITLSNVDSAEQSYVGNLLTFQNGQTLHVGFTGQAQSFVVVAGGGATTLYGSEDPPSCFAQGTRLATPTGDIAVESLQVGDLVRLARGGEAQIRWLGHRRVRCARHPKPHDVLPVRVRAGALGVGRPGRDLVLSPDHAVFLRGVLIPVRYLLNGATIVQEAAESVTYWHLELDRHDVVLAEGLPCESFLDTGNRGAFDNAPAPDLHPDFARRAMAIWAHKAYAPLVLEGPELTAARTSVQRRATALGFVRTRDAGLRVLLDGAPVPTQTRGLISTVILPAGTREMRVVSNIWVPAHMRPTESDTRSLGIAIDRLWLDGREVALDSPSLCAGWHPAEPGLRWTNGDGRISVAGARSIAFSMALTGCYWRECAPATAVSA
jgi:hypothetical protein